VVCLPFENVLVIGNDWIWIVSTGYPVLLLSFENKFCDVASSYYCLCFCASMVAYATDLKFSLFLIILIGVAFFETKIFHFSGNAWF